MSRKFNSSLLSPSLNCERLSYEKDPNNSFLVNSNSNVKSPEKNFNPEFLFNATNALIYGEKILKLHHGSFYHDCFFYISERKLHHLQWISFKKKFYESRINLLKVSLIHDITSFDFHKSDKSNVFLYIVYSNLANKKKKLTLKFPSFQRKNLFWQGILFFMKESNHLQRNRTHFDLMASGFICSGSNEKEMNFIEMIRFLKDRQIFIEEEELKTVMAKLNFDFDFRKTFFFNKNLFKKILGELVDYNEFIQIFSNYCKNWLEGNKKPDYFMSLDELKKFFLIEQNENLDEIYLKKLLKTKSINLNKPQEVNNDKISLTKLKSILFSMNNQIFDVKKMAIYQNMNHPLTDYYIKSSHNTYLNSNQIIGVSSVEAYIKALSKGYRCIELDCWDGDKGEPIIYHGFTLTTKIQLSNVLQALNDFGFVKNTFPIILSIENHCSKSQQQKMSDLIQQILGKNLYILPENHEKFEHFPSLFELRKKFLIKTKIPFLIESKKKFPKWTKSKYSSKVYNFEFVSYVSSLNSEALKDESCLNDDFFLEYNKEKNENFSLAENLGILGSKKVSNNSVKSIFKIKEQLAKNEQNSKAYVFMNKIIEMSESHHSKSLVSSSQDYPNSFITFIEKGLILDGAISTFRSIESNNQSINEVEMSEKKSCADISKPLSRPSHFSKFDLSKINESFKHCISLLGNKLNLKKYHEQSVFSICSLDENTISKTFIENEKTITDFHRKYFSRIYPVGTRIDSSNYDPLYSILAGSQMIALNIQTADIPLLIYSAMFTENGGTNSGYLLKPKFLRHDYNKEKDFYPSMMNTVKKIIKLKILSGQQIAGKNKCLNLHLYLEVSIRGIRLDETENKIFKSEIIKKNLIYVTINLNVEFEIRCPKICFLVFQIFAKNELVSDERLAWYCIPVSCMRQGYRVIQLLNNSLEPHENSLLFVRCQIIKKLG